MKKILSCVVAVAAALSLCAPACAAALPQGEAAYTITVNDKVLDLSSLPLAPYPEGNTVMVPLRLVGEALGYAVGWNAETRAITIDDRCVQNATLFSGTAAAVFKGELQIIDMSREVQNAAETVICEGCTYVPLEFFREFFNDTAVSGNVITIAPGRSELLAGDPAAAMARRQAQGL